MLKMITNIENLNLLKSHSDAIGHCANCFNTMGSGIARTIRLELPEAYEADCLTQKGNEAKLGHFSLGIIKSPQNSIRYVYNLYGQFNYGTDFRRLNYEAIYTSLLEMKVDCLIKGDIKTVGFPKNMGCALAGGDWNIVNAMIESVFGSTNLDVLICEYGPK